MNFRELTSQLSVDVPEIIHGGNSCTISIAYDTKGLTPINICVAAAARKRRCVEGITIARLFEPEAWRAYLAATLMSGPHISRKPS